MQNTFTTTAFKPNKPYSPLKDLHVVALNLFAPVEAILGRKVDWNEAATSGLLCTIL